MEVYIIVMDRINPKEAANQSQVNLLKITLKNSSLKKMMNHSKQEEDEDLIWKTAC